jgi:hypothetical protein
MQLMKSFKGFDSLYGRSSSTSDINHVTQGDAALFLRATQCFERYMTRSKNGLCKSFSRSGLLAVFVTGCNYLRGPVVTKACAI